MDNEKKKELREQYDQRHPKMGIICWQCGDDLWVDMSTDANADYNGTSFCKCQYKNVVLGRS